MFLNFFVGVYLNYYVVLIITVQQSNSVKYIYIYIYIHIFFHVPFQYYLSQDVEYSSQCSAVGPCCLSMCQFACATP